MQNKVAFNNSVTRSYKGLGGLIKIMLINRSISGGYN